MPWKRPMNSTCFQNANVALGLMATMNRGFSDGKCVFFSKRNISKEKDTKPFHFGFFIIGHRLRSTVILKLKHFHGSLAFHGQGFTLFWVYQFTSLMLTIGNGIYLHGRNMMYLLKVSIVF